jgi:exonuclease III
MKSKSSSALGYKLWYSSRDKNRKGVGIIINRKFIDDVVEVQRKNNKILSIKIMIRGKIATVTNAYAPQIGLDNSIKQ